MNRENGRRLLLAVALLLVSLIATGQSLLLVKPIPVNPKLLQGYWEGVGPGGECSVTISGKSLRYATPKTKDPEADFWFETSFKVPANADFQQLHATIKDNSPDKAHIGKVIVALFKIVDGTLTLGVINSFDESPEGPVAGDWQDVIDSYTLKRAKAPSKKGKQSSINSSKTP